MSRTHSVKREESGWDSRAQGSETVWTGAHTLRHKLLWRHQAHQERPFPL